MNKDIKKEILQKIEKKQITPRPKSYFQLLKIGIYSLSVILFVLATYTINLIFYLPTRTIRLAEQAGPWEYLSLFPWPLLIVGAGLTGLLIYIYRNYEGGYKKHLLVTTLVVFILTVATGSALANLNLNEALEQRPGFRRMYEWQDDNFVPRGPKNKFRRNHEQRMKEINENSDLNKSFPATIKSSEKNRACRES